MNQEISNKLPEGWKNDETEGENQGVMVNVSDIRQYEFCPRAVYLEKVLNIKPVETLEEARGLLGHAIRVELSLRKSRILQKMHDSSEIKLKILEEIDRIIEDVPFVYREKLGKTEYKRYLNVVKSEIMQEIDKLVEKFTIIVDKVGIEKAIEIFTPFKIEYSLRSTALKMKGRVDMIMKENGLLVPVEIKTGHVPDTIWEGDRLQLCAYSMLIEEKFGAFVNYGFIEYTRISERRPVMITESLRRRTIAARDEVIAIIEGRIPDICPHGNGTKCESCKFNKSCYTI